MTSLMRASAASSWASPTTTRSLGASRSTLAAHGAELAFTYQGDSLRKRVEPLAASVGSHAAPALRRRGSRLGGRRFAELEKRWGKLDFLVHAIAFSDKNELKGRYADTSPREFHRTMVISCFSFTEIAKRAASMMHAGGSMSR